jgi:DNA-binding NarL/FixJ family response regulator
MSDTKNKQKIFVVDDHVLFREGLVWIIQQEKDLEVIGEAADGAEALEQLKKLKPHLVLVDVGLTGMSGIELAKKIRTISEEVRILMISMHQESLYAERALRAGANGYIMKRASSSDLIAAIRQVLKGQSYLSKAFNESLIQRVAGAGRKVKAFALDLLSDRELEVFQRVGQGLGTREIADELEVSMKTIEAHKEHIRAKLTLETNSALIQHAIHWVHSEKVGL